MIASLEGDILAVDADSIVIDVNGLGFSVRMSSRDTARLHAGQHERIITQMTVSQDAIGLYGFTDAPSKKLFMQLQKVSGIGPKVAMAILSTLSVQDLSAAIRDNDVTALTRAPGLGKKGAQKVILELRGSVDLELSDGSAQEGSSPQSDAIDHNIQQVVLGLVSLGWQQKDAYSAAKTAVGQLGLEEPLGDDDVPRVLRAALSDLDRGR